MSYDAHSPILGQGQASAEQINAFMQARGRALAADYAPDGQYQKPPTQLAWAIVDECQRYPEHVVNHDDVAAQIADETAGWQSAFARERNNPGGIGAINSDPNQAIRFPSVAAGVRAHVAHVLNYVVARGPWSADDPRTENIAAAGWLGVVRVLADLNGRWAYPGTTYGQSIAELANQLLATTGGTPVGTIPTPPMDTSHPSPNRDGFSATRRVEAIVWHISQGTLDSNLSWLTNPNSGASANYEIAKDGTIYELVPPEHSAWTNGPMQQPDLSNPVIAGWHDAGVNANTRTISIEHEGYSSDNQGGSLTQVQIDSHIWLTAWLCEAFNLPPDRTHIIGHYQLDHVDRPYCPGFSDQEWRDWVAAVASYGQQAPPAAVPAPPHDARVINGHTVQFGFLGLYEALERAGLHTQTLGLPLSDEIPAPIPGVDAAQKWERAWTVYQQAENPQITVAQRGLWPALEALG